MRPKNDTTRIDALLGEMADDLLVDTGQPLMDSSLRVERLLLEIVRPDPVQPRRVLPESIHMAFHANRLTPAQALRELVQLVQLAARQRGRPFSNVLELLPHPDDESDNEAVDAFSPEEQLLRDLVNLAITIRDDGQVNPLTVVDVSQGVTQQFRIETGERRYWATWLLRDFIADFNGDGTVPCIIIPAERASVFRQAKENTARSGLSAIAMARQAALLLLTAHEVPIPTSVVSNDFYRQALGLDLRNKREYTGAILAAMGGINKTRLAQYKALLYLSDEAMELADRYSIDERKLRHVIALEPGYHVEVVRQIIDLKLTAKQVKELCEGDTTSHQDNEPDQIPAPALKIARITQATTSTSAHDIARALIQQEGDRSLARARLQALRKLLTDAEQFLQEA